MRDCICILKCILFVFFHFIYQDKTQKYTECFLVFFVCWFCAIVVHNSKFGWEFLIRCHFQPLVRYAQSLSGNCCCSKNKLERPKPTGYHGKGVVCITRSQSNFSRLLKNCRCFQPLWLGKYFVAFMWGLSTQLWGLSWAFLEVLRFSSRAASADGCSVPQGTSQMPWSWPSRSRWDQNQPQPLVCPSVPCVWSHPSWALASAGFSEPLASASAVSQVW